MTTTDDEISNRILKSDRNFQIQFDFVSLIVCMKLVRNIVLVLQKIKQAKTRTDLNGKRVGSTKWNIGPRWDLNP